MIFPLLRGLRPLALAPATWFFVAINIFVYIVNFPQFAEDQTKLDGLFEQSEFMRTQGSAFSQYVLDTPRQHSSFLRKMAKKATDGDSVSQMRMGGYALRNTGFMTEAEDREFHGDAIALAKWRADFIELREIQTRHPTYRWGLSSARPNWVNWISYQFAHSGFQHLFWNLVFLAFFATFLESVVGSSLVTLIYLGAGVSGAALFQAISGLTYSPLIGASGAVSGLMACVAVLSWNEGIRFFYWLLPVQGYFGVRDLPAWLIAVVFLLPDLAGQISSVSDANGMAYSAHLGGALFGCVFGFAIKYGFLEKEEMPPAEEIW